MVLEHDVMPDEYVPLIISNDEHNKQMQLDLRRQRQSCMPTLKNNIQGHA